MPVVNAYEAIVCAGRALYGCWIETPPVLDIDLYFPMARVLERNWRDIQREALALQDGQHRIPKLDDMMENQADIAAADSIPWRFLVLRLFGRDHAANQSLCPLTSRLIKSIPKVTTAGISILDPGKHILAHRGPYRGMLRYHLGLVTPTDEKGDGQAVLRLGDLFYRWRDGEGILWDDTFEHEVWNHGDTPRIVLIVDVARPDMPLPLRAIDRLAFLAVSKVAGNRRTLERCTAVPRNNSVRGLEYRTNGSRR